MRLAYLCNLYPAVSHSFVRREIEGLEHAGHQVHRFSLRPARSDLKDEADLREAECTEAVLAKGPARLVISALILLLSRPLRSVAALGAAWRLSGPGLITKLRHGVYWLEAAWLVRRFENLRVQHVHAHFGTNPAAIALLVKAFGGPPFSFTAHGPDEFDAPVALSLRAKIDEASLAVAISSYGVSQLMRWSKPERWNRIILVRCGLDSDFLNAAEQPVSEESTDFVCVARLSAQKGLPLLIAACDRLRGDGANFALTIIGGGELKAELEAEIAQRGLQDHVRLAGICSASQIRSHLLAARAFVLPSFAEGLPVALMEALALCRPVITTAIAGIPELVDQECGWLIPAGSEDALVEAMRDALEKPAIQLQDMGECGRDRVRSMHNANSNAAVLQEAIRQAISREAH